MARWKKEHVIYLHSYSMVSPQRENSVVVVFLIYIGPSEDVRKSLGVPECDLVDKQIS